MATLDRSGAFTLLEDRDEFGRKTRRRASVKYQGCRLPGVIRVRSQNTGNKFGFFLVHIESGRALHMNPMSWERGEELINELLECPIELDKITDSLTAKEYKEYYVRRLSGTAERMATE